ncbi:helix-turn-helix domain-containing protein [Govanella unica]|uniref:DUF4115 domain-containing protein n=1 Tax=Govanella unica TaxID=2975056 RepID=A0A9X3Z5U6_9PROT|nr:helix-turn-helix domain-containing protein [Govania unica]MDA5192348.1 DUF4115 domain-containing protein [Govania unica]
MVQHLSPRDFDKDARQPQLTLVSSNLSGTALEDMPDTIGGVLRRARLARGANSLEEIAEDLRIRPHLLAALEADDFSQLPGIIYAAGFLRTYAQYLGLDAAPLVERLKDQSGVPVKTAPLVFPEPINDPRIPRLSLVALAGILCIAVYGAWYSFSGPSTTRDIVPEPSREMAELALPETAELEQTPVAPQAPVAAFAPAAPDLATPPAALTPPPAAPVVAGEGQMLLRASADSWIRITDANRKIIAERTLKAGESFAVAGNAGYLLLAGNAGGLTIVAGGKSYGPLGGNGDVRRNFALDSATVAQSLPAIP